MPYSSNDQQTDNARPRAILVSVCLPNEDYEAKQWSLDELERLADTAGIETVGKTVQKRKKISSSSYVGKGFLDTIEKEMERKGAELLIFDNLLSPSQGKNLQNSHGIDAVDRTEVILQVFHDHARTPESRMQVRLAELEYQLPRLKALWSHLDRQRGSTRATAGGGRDAQRGVGEKQIEIDRRLILREISQIKKKLRKVDLLMEVTGKKRAERKRVCLVGYTNAGKSTLFNRLTDASVLVEDKLFATLDSTARSLNLGKGSEIILTDTVGFISDLPHHLVASFRATLREVVEADLLLHVVDVSDHRWEHHIEAVHEVLESIGAHEVPQIYVLNKLDRASPAELETDPKVNGLKNHIAVSAKQGTHIDQLTRRIDEALNESQTVDLLIPFADSKVINWLHRFCEVESREYKEEGVFVRALINAEDMKTVEKFRVI